MQAILVATDFSPTATLAVERAARLAAERDAQLHLVHVFNESAWQSLASVYDPARLAGLDPTRHARQHLEALSALTQQKSGVGITCAVLVGRASREIVAYAGKHAVNLIVLGIRGAHLIQEMTVGGTALKVLDRTPCAVLAVRRAPQETYDTAIVATDFSATACRALMCARALLPPQTLHLAHAFHLPFESWLRLADVSESDLAACRASTRREVQARLRAVAGDETPDALLHALAGHPVAALLDLASDLGANLIVIGRHSGPVLVERLLGSVTQNLLHRAATDVLVVP